MRSEKILVVEDETIAARLIEKKLHSMGLNVVEIIMSGEEALKHLSEHIPDLILMDISLSGDMTGIDVVKRLNSPNPLPVVYLTGHTDRETLAKMIETSPYGYIPKPINDSIFNFMIETSLERSRTDRELLEKKIELTTHKEQLENLVHERTRELIGLNESLKKEILEREKVESELRKHTEIIEQDMESARVVQRSFLPRIPENDLAFMSYRYRPAHAVGGDYLSITPLQEGGLGIFVGDVSGHGASAALITAMIKSISNSICRQFGGYPARYMETLNRELIPELIDGTFLTAFYSVLNRHGESVLCTCSRGGHPAPIVWRKKDTSIELIETDGIILGAFDDSQYAEDSLDLYPGDRLFIYTDGITEAQNKDRVMFRHEGMIDIISPLCNEHRNLDAVLDAIIKTACDFNSSSSWEDDMLIIGIEIKNYFP